MNLISEEYLMHHGVKGMKWGIRHDPERTGRKTHKQKANDRYREKYSKIGSPSHSKQWYKKASDAEITKDRYKRNLKTGAIVAGALVAAGVMAYSVNQARVDMSIKYENAKMFELQRIPLKDISNETTVIKEGTEFKRVIRNFDEKRNDLTKTEPKRDVTWNTFVKNDTKIYKNFFNIRGRGDTIEYTRKAKTDIIAPSERQRLITFMSLLNTDRKFQDAFAKEVGISTGITTYTNGHRTVQDTRKMYANFTKQLGAKNSKTAAIYFDKLREKGFNAVTDDYDQNFLGKHPIILLNTSKDTIITGKRKVTNMSKIIDLLLTNTV